GAQRSEPTGGAAYGIPLYTRTDGSIPVLPSTSPSCTRTASPACVQAENSPTISKTASQGIILQSHKRQPWKSTRRETMIVEGWVSGDSGITERDTDRGRGIARGDVRVRPLIRHPAP